MPLATAIAVEWVAEVWVDPDWYEAQESDDPCPSPGLPAVVELAAKSVLVGRPSTSRNIHPEIDCTGDPGVSRRQAQLTTDGQRWWVEDLQSSNGTYVGPASGPLPTDPVPPGQRRELSEDDRIYVGAWTRLVVRARHARGEGALRHRDLGAGHASPARVTSSAASSTVSTRWMRPAMARPVASAASGDHTGIVSVQCWRSTRTTIGSTVSSGA